MILMSLALVLRRRTKYYVIGKSYEINFQLLCSNGRNLLKFKSLEDLIIRSIIKYIYLITVFLILKVKMWVN